MQPIITIEIEAGRLLVNSQQLFAGTADAEVFLKELYHFLRLDYLKFFKMDNLCKLGFLAAEALFKYHPAIKQLGDDELALVFSNRSSSLDTDSRYWQGVVSAEPVASPALFVYTLPNIVQGEIAIRHKLYGENIFLIIPGYQAEELEQQARLLINAGKAKACITGWADYNNGAYHAVFKLVE